MSTVWQLKVTPSHFFQNGNIELFFIAEMARKWVEMYEDLLLLNIFLLGFYASLIAPCSY